MQQQQRNPITVIMNNPPYSRRRRNGNDVSGNINYPKLEHNIQSTYMTNSKNNSVLYMNLYNSYIKAIRWASDRIGKQGIIGFITSNGYINSKSTNGFRKSLY